MPSLEMEVEEAVRQSGIFPQGSEQARHTAEERWAALSDLRRAVILLLISLAAIAINGFHPFGEDAGIYVAGIKQAAHPGLFGSSGVFIDPYIHMSIFFEGNAWILRSTHLSIASLLLAEQILTTWLSLYACSKLAAKCFATAEEHCAAVLLVASCLSVPAAGTSLFLMDPYLTSRSFSVPFTLLALSSCLEQKAIRSVLLLLLVGIFHPLMAVYAAFSAVLLWSVVRRVWKGAVGLVASAITGAAALHFLRSSIAESPAYRSAVFSRNYFFLDYWRWYEIVGIVAPLAILAAYATWRKQDVSVHGKVLAEMCVILGAALTTISLLFARPSNHSHLIAALQPLRPFLWIYFCMFLLLGGTLGKYWLKQIPWRWALLYLGVSSSLAFLQHRTYASSPQVELPWLSNANGWSKAFLWIKGNTPPDAVVALDAGYIHAFGEDAQGFRAIAERDSLADFSKDGGAAAVFPQVAERWMREQTATTGLNRIGDEERRKRLAPFHVGWIVLSQSARTAMACPFADDLVKVCRLQ